MAATPGGLSALASFIVMLNSECSFDKGASGRLSKNLQAGRGAGMNRVVAGADRDQAQADGRSLGQSL
ncbi:MAG: hypothetical protein ACO3BE_12880, partial [Gemmobacter sp.]